MVAAVKNSRGLGWGMWVTDFEHSVHFGHWTLEPESHSMEHII